MDNNRDQIPTPVGQVQSLAPADLKARRELHDATRLAAQKKYRCRRCCRVDHVTKAVLVAFAGNVLLAICPGCMAGPIVLERVGGSIQVTMPSLQAGRRIISPSDFTESDVAPVNVVPEQVKL